jgi:hypothetical protein
MTREQAKQIIISQVRQAEEYIFEYILIDSITDYHTNENAGFYIVSRFTSFQKDSSSNYDVKLIVFNDGRIEKL